MSDAVLDLQLIRAVLGRCAVALPVLRTICKHAGLRQGAETAEQILTEVNLAIAEADRFADEVCKHG